MSLQKELRIPAIRKIKHASLLIVGDVEKHSKTLAEVLLAASESDSNNRLSLKIHLADRLPLDKDENDLLEIDLVLMVVDVVRKGTLSSVQKSLQHLPMDFFQGRILFLAHNSNSFTKLGIEHERISQLANSCLSPVIWETIHRDNIHIAAQILQKINLVTRSYDLPPSICTERLCFEVEGLG
ncbi:centromere protein M-like [Styela clava]